jgi:hypothetical protein
MSELAAREAALLKKEAELAAREAALSKKETEGKKIHIVNYLSNYEGEYAESEVFIGSDEKIVSNEVFDWMVENRKGLDFDMALQILKEEGDSRFNYKELIAHVRTRCNSFNDLKNICREYNDSYFEDYNGWKLKFKSK